jgi:hypothetical protein
MQLYTLLTTSFIKALLGFERNITLLDGNDFLLKRSGVTQPGQSINAALLASEIKERR